MNYKVNIKQIRNNKNFRNGMLYTIFSFINNGISFILVLILARYLSPSEYGQLNLFTTFVTLLNIFISLCTSSYVAVSFFQKSKEEIGEIIHVVFETTTIVFIIVSILLLLFPTVLGKIIGISAEYLWIGLIICYFGVYNNVNLDIWRLEEKPISYGIYSLSFAICNFILSFILIVGFKYGWEGRVYSWIILATLYFVVSVLFLMKRKYLVFSRPSSTLWKETLMYAMPLIPHSISFWLKQGLDRYIINYFYDSTVVGYFSFAMNLASIIVIVGSAFNSTNSVFIYKKLSLGYHQVKETLTKQTKMMTIVFFIVCMGVIAFAHGLIAWCIPQFINSTSYILPLCIGGFFQCIYLLWVNYLFFYKKTTQLMHITISTALVQVILSIWLTRYSPVLTAYISMVITALTMFLVYLRSKKEIEKQKNFSEE